MKSVRMTPAVVWCIMTLHGLGFSENARTEAMGGISIINDFGHVLYHPASINDFPDQFTGTSGAYTDTGGNRVDYIGPVMGKKSLGKTVTIGFIANTVGDQGSSVLRSGFYDAARSFLIEHSGDTLPVSFPMLPHALIGLDFGAVSLGGEVYYERSRYRRTVADTDRRTDLGIRNFGGVLSATVALGNAWFCPLLGVGMPTIEGEKRDSTTRSFESSASQYLTGGAEAGMELPALTLTAGAYATKEHYAFACGPAAGPDYTATILDLYAGFTTQVLDSMLLAVQYDATLYFDDIADTAVLSRFEYHDAYGYHGIRLGVERPYAASGLFDAVIPRAGMSYTFSSAREQWDTVTTHAPLSAGDVRLNAGIGVRKGVFCLDVFVNIGAWNGLLTGPQTMAATLTVGLSKEFLGN